MRLFLWLGAISTLAAGLLGKPDPQAGSWVIVVAGNTQGYLSPCGCTKPMHGGIRRRVSATKSATTNQSGRLPSLIIETGSLTKGRERQDELKLDALGDALGEAKADVVALAPDDLELGSARLSAFQRLSKAVLLTGSFSGDPLPVQNQFAKGPFVVGSELGDDYWPIERASRYAAQLCDSGQAILITHGGLDRARALAKAEPRLLGVVYRTSGQVALAPTLEGSTWLVSPGVEGKAALRFEFNGRRLENYSVLDLGPDVKDDPQAATLYRRYLDRVRAERLLERVPKTSDVAFVGNKQCGSCHEKEYAIWKSSKHAEALATLESDGHDADPDCVGCHVVGLSSSKGFVARERTPELANVGCESCHGGGAEHASRPAERPMPKVGEKSCSPCHNLAHSPTFEYKTYWKKIAH
ncbi:cytochrome c family protein [Kamptonema cortianum]|nr:cytochrome c family protein [Geitlerinema splendidum]MDK3162140.1 cytochrome c family protein [Kamptonema cortianum]